MTVHFRRRKLSRLEEIGALSVSVLAGLGGAAAAYYLTRLFLSREAMGAPETVGAPEQIGARDDEDRIATTARGRLPAAGGTASADG